MSKKIKYVGIGLIAVLLVVSAFVFISQVRAAPIDFFVDTMSDLTYSTASNHDFVFAPITNIVAGDDIVITFASGFTGVGTVVVGDLNLTDNGSPVSLAADCTTPTDWSVTTSSGARTIIITACASATTIPAGDTVELTVSNTKITNPDGTANPYTITLGAPDLTDAGSTQVDIVGPQDVNVGGTVTQSITFSLGSHAVSFGQLSSAHPKTSTHSIVLSTNAGSGMIITVNGTTLHSPAVTPTKFIAACNAAAAPQGGAGVKCTSAHGTQQFGLNLVLDTTAGDLNTAVPLFSADVPASAAPSGTAPIGIASANYDTPNQFTFHDGDTVAQSAVPINTTTYVASYLANISGSTAAGTYTTTLTYIATTYF